MSNRKNDNNPYSKFSNKDYDFVSNKTNYNKTIISDFFNLILLGEISKLDSFLFNYPYLNKSLNSEEDSPYHVVVESNLSNHKKINLIKYLKSKDFNINVQNKMGDTPLLIASKQFNIDVIDVLINSNADINISNYLNINPIHYIFKGSIKQCKDLKIQPIIDEPNVKFDKVANSQNYNKAKENYKNIRVLLNDKFSNFESYINTVLKSTNFERDFTEVRESTLAKIKSLLSEISINDNEKRNEVQKMINLASNEVYKKVLILSDPQIFDPFDFTPSFNTVTGIETNNLKLPNNDEYYIDLRPKLTKSLDIRYSMFKEFLKGDKINIAFPDTLVNSVKKMTSELIDLDETILEPTVYSIICDYYDHILINELKNKFNEIIKSKFKEELKNIKFSDDIKLPNFSNSDLVDLDVNFGLDLSKSENEIHDFVNSKIKSQFNEKLLSFGQILTANKRNVVFDTDDKGTTHIFYPQDFLVSIKSPTMCTSYNEDLLDKVLGLNTDFNFRDIYGNNILFYAINSQNYLAIQKIKDKLENDDFERLLKSKNNNKDTPIEFCEKKLSMLKKYFADDELNILGKMSSFYENDLKNNIEDIDIHKNVLKNYELIPFIPLYLLHMNTVTPINTPTTLNFEYEYLPTPISTSIEKSSNESKKLMEKYKLLKSVPISFFLDSDSGKSKFKNIIEKNSLGRKTKENDMLKKEFDIVCFTIDHILGKSLLNVLKRLTYTFFKFKYPSSVLSEDYVEAIKDRLEDKFKKIESYITTNVNFDIYEPSEYTKRIVSIHGDYKLNEYTDDSEVEIFNYIIEVIKEEGEKIDENEPIMEHLTRVIRPYFFGYYNTAIKTIQNSISGYENYISNYIILTEIIELLSSN